MRRRRLESRIDRTAPFTELWRRERTSVPISRAKTSFARTQVRIRPVHRVAAVPSTGEWRAPFRSSGRDCRAVLPEAEDVDIHIGAMTCGSIQCASSGAGGQHVNTNRYSPTHIRITHLPKGWVVHVPHREITARNRDTIADAGAQCRLYDRSVQRVDVSGFCQTRAAAPRGLRGSLGTRSEQYIYFPTDG